MQKIVMVPLDGSRFAEQALPFAVSVARAEGAALELVRVHPGLPFGLPPDDARLYLDQTAAQLQPALGDGTLTRLILHPYPELDYVRPSSHEVADALCEHAARPAVSLIVMATHGFGGLKRVWLGSVADALIRMAPRPVLLVRPDAADFTLAAAADRGFHHVLIALDGSETAERVVPLAQSFASAFGARFTLLRAVSPLSWELPYSPYPIPAYGPPLSQEAALDYLEGIAAPLRSAGADVTVRVVQGASAAALIVDYAQAHGADLIAIGTEGAGRVRRLLLGSVSDKVVRSSDVPVLVCNVRLTDGEAYASAAGAAEHA